MINMQHQTTSQEHQWSSELTLHSLKKKKTKRTKKKTQKELKNPTSCTLDMRFVHVGVDL